MAHGEFTELSCVFIILETLMIVRYIVDDNYIKWIKFMKHLLSLYRSRGAPEYWICILELHEHDMIQSM